MAKKTQNISEIETYLNEILDNKVSNNTFFTTYPDIAYVQASDWKDMIVVDIPSGIKDMDAMGKGNILIGLYARPLESGRKNVAKMAELEDKLNAVLENASNSRYMLIKSDAHATFDVDINWHCNVVELSLLVV